MSYIQADSIKQKIHLLVFALVLPLGGCLATGDPFGLNTLNDSAAQMLGSYQAPTLAAYPTSSGCAGRDERCRALDDGEAYLYQEARAGRITWVELVNRFYAARTKLYPNSNDNYGARELFSFQRMLAEKMDQRMITESQWVYLIEQKSAQMRSQARQDAANEAVINQQQQTIQSPIQSPKNCWTTGTKGSYYTTCN